MENTKKCAVCDRLPLFSCQNCLSIAYCSQGHQEVDWGKHKLNCRLFRIKPSTDPDDIFPYHCIANCNLNPGTILLEEPSIFHFSNVMMLGKSTALLRASPSCVACGSVTGGSDIPPRNNFDILESVSCSVCSWPVCSRECQKLPMHADNECKILEVCKITFNTKMLVTDKTYKYFAAQVVKILRALAVHRNNSELWRTLMSIPMPSNVKNENHSCSKMDEALTGAISFLAQIFKEAKLNSYVDFVLKFPTVKSVFYAQGFDDHDRTSIDPRFRHRWSTYMYKETSNFSHSCSPNCSWNVGPYPDFKIRIRTAVSVQKGDILTISRIQNKREAHCGTLLRQRILKKTYGFQCYCNLCLDPTEFGTYMSALACKMCHKLGKKGYVLPLDPTDVNEHFQLWRCVRCNKLSSESAHLANLQNLSSRMGIVCDSRSRISNSQKQSFCYKIMTKYRDNILHPNHWLLQEAAKNWITATLRSIYIVANYSKSDVEKCFALNMVLLAVLDKVSPGLCLQQAKVRWIAYLSFFYILLKERISLESLSEDRIGEIIATQEVCRGMFKDVLLYYRDIFPPRGCIQLLIVQQVIGMKENVQRLTRDIKKKLSSMQAMRRVDSRGE